MTTATRARREVMDIAGNVSVLDREAIERSGARSVPELLRREAGLFVTNTTTNPAFTSVEARGFNNGGTAGSALLVLVDGRRANEADSGVAEWAFLDIDEVYRIEIVRGPASAVWGDNAVGGVIQIFTRPPDGVPRGTLRVSGGIHETGRGSIAASGRDERMLVSLFGSFLTTDGYRDRSNYKEGIFNGRVEFDLSDRAVLSVGGGTVEDKRNFPGALFVRADGVPIDEIRDLGRRAASPRSEADESKVESSYVDAVLEAILADDVLLRVQPAYRWRKDDVTITSANPFVGTVTIDADKQAVSVDSQIQIDRPLGPFANRVVIGGALLGDFTDRDIASAFPSKLESRRLVFSGFLQEELQLTENLLLAGGVRYDQADYRLEESTVTMPGTETRTTTTPDWGIFSPKASLVYHIIPPLSAYASYARGFRFPNFDEGAPIFGEIPDLEPQTSHSYEVGFKLDTERARASVAFYWMDVDNELMFNPVDFQNENFDKVRHRGIEVSSAFQLCDWFTLLGSYTLDDVQIRDQAGPAGAFSPAFDFGGSRVPITPLHHGSVGFFAELPYWFELTYNVNVVGERYLANDFDNDRQRLGGYVTQDLFLAFRPPLEEILPFGERLQGALTFGIQNLAGESYNDFGGTTQIFPPPAFTAVQVDGVNPAARRTWEVGLVITVRR